MLRGARGKGTGEMQAAALCFHRHSQGPQKASLGIEGDQVIFGHMLWDEGRAHWEAECRFVLGKWIELVI